MASIKTTADGAQLALTHPEASKLIDHLAGVNEKWADDLVDLMLRPDTATASTGAQANPHTPRADFRSSLRGLEVNALRVCWLHVVVDQVKRVVDAFEYCASSRIAAAFGRRREARSVNKLAQIRAQLLHPVGHIHGNGLFLFGC